MILMDLSHALHRCTYMNKEEIKANPDFLTHILTSQVLSFADKFGASKTNKMVVCMDSTSWRKEYYDINKVQFPEMREMTYKGNRIKDPSIDWPVVYGRCDAITEVLKNYSDFYVMKVKGAEADDVIAILTKKFAPTETIWIPSGDKDFVQLQAHNVHQFDPIKKCFKPEQDVEMFKKIHCIAGDTGDNIPAIKPRTKEKTAIKMLKDLDTLLQTNPEMRAKYKFNQDLILFENIPDWVEKNILDEYDKQGYTYNGMKLLTEFTKLKLVKHAEDINKFRLVDVELKTKLNQFFIQAKANQSLTERNLEDFFS